MTAPTPTPTTPTTPTPSAPDVVGALLDRPLLAVAVVGVIALVVVAQVKAGPQAKADAAAWRQKKASERANAKWEARQVRRPGRGDRGAAGVGLLLVVALALPMLALCFVVGDLAAVLRDEAAVIGAPPAAARLAPPTSLTTHGAVGVAPDGSDQHETE